ncbi:MAG: hypothetical protein QE263_09105 [Vampirovibrionales bacterium]|nr:hypothetical protein [Vampirovibrionales bacterium]
MTSVPTTSAGDTHTASLGISKVVWWAVFIADSLLMSHWLQQFKLFTLTPGMGSGLSLAGFSVAFILATSVLVYDGYAKEWGKGTIRNTIPWFESVVRWQLMRHSLAAPPQAAPTSVSLSSMETTV